MADDKQPPKEPADVHPGAAVIVLMLEATGRARAAQANRRQGR
jgi:hypothetical protein